MRQEHSENVVPGSKQDAVLRSDPTGRILNVHRDTDWFFIRSTKPLLKCPEVNCEVKLVAVDRQGTRHFRNAKGSVDCHHFTARSADHSTRGGGPMSDEHLWYQSEIAKQVRRRSHLRVTVEDYDSKADLLILNVKTNRSVAIEIQRWDTDIRGRTEHRMSLGHEVIWLITDSATLSPETRHEVFTNRGAFVRVRSFSKPYTTLSPWDADQPRTTPVIEVSGTIGRLDTTSSCIRATRMPLLTVLEEILDGKREWIFPGPSIYKSSSGAGRSGGSWVRHIDYVNANILESGLSIPLVPESSRYGRLSGPIEASPQILTDQIPPTTRE